MVAVPALTAVTLPFSTVATVSSLEVQVTVLSSALSGLTVAVRVSFLPTSRVRAVLFSSMLATGTGVGVASFTVTAQEADCSPALAVIIALPEATAVTLPVESTVATSGLSEDQATVSVVSDGVTVAVRVSVAPTVKVSSSLLRLMPVAGVGAAVTLTTEFVTSYSNSSSSSLSKNVSTLIVTFLFPDAPLSTVQAKDRISRSDAPV